MKNLILFLSLFLLACSTVSNPPAVSALLHKERLLDAPYFLSETHYESWIQLNIDSQLISRPGREGDCRYDPQNCFPTVNDYSRNIAGWQQWQIRSGAQFRILGLLPAGTRYHFYNIIIPKTWMQALPILLAEIDSGPFKGTKAYFQFDKKLAQDLPS